MQTPPPSITEAEVGKKIIYMHDTLNMGFRRISKALESEGILGYGKDRVNRMYWKHRVSAEDNANVKDNNDGLVMLAKTEGEAGRKRELARAKNEKKRRIAILTLEEIDELLESRQQIYRQKSVLLRVAKRVLPVMNPVIWLRLTDYCEENGSGLAEALRDALGPQVDFEQARTEDLQEGYKYYFDVHLAQCIENWLSEKEEDRLKKTVDSTNGRQYEIFTIERP